MKLVSIQEGPMRLKVSATALKPPHKGDVFFNPSMAENRALSSLALGACLPLLEGSSVLDAFCGCGARGIRYALENQLERVVFLDANPEAIELARENVKLNNLSSASFFEGLFQDFNEKMDVVEIDPFGTPAPFFNKAISLCKPRALLSVTATDLATLCGRQNKPAQERYDAKPLYVEYAHELALRIILGKIAREAACGVTPLFCFYKGHYVKLFVLVEKNKKQEELGFLSHCFKCGNRRVGRFKRCSCGHAFAHAGPLWIGRTSDERVLERMKEKSGEKILETIEKENALPPYFFDAHKLAKRIGAKIRPFEGYLSALRRAGFKAERTHYSPTAFKTNAPYAEILKIFKTSLRSPRNRRSP